MAPPAKKTKTEHVPTGDDLEDNFALDDDLVATAFSDQEAGDPADLSDDAAAVGGSDDEGDGDARPAKKRRADPSSSNDEAPAAGDASAAAAPKSKRAAKRAKDKKRAKVAEAGLDERDKDDMGLLPPEALADRLADKQRRALPNLSALELDEQRISRASPTRHNPRRVVLTLLSVRDRVDDPRHGDRRSARLAPRLHERGCVLPSTVSACADSH